MKNEFFIESIDEILTGAGFKRMRSTWRRVSGDFVQLIDLQKSRYSNCYYVNLAWGLRSDFELNMKRTHEYHCPFRLRLSAAFPRSERAIETAFTFESEQDEKARQRQTRALNYIERKALPLMDKLTAAPALLKAVSDGLFEYGAIEPAALKKLRASAGGIKR